MTGKIAYAIRGMGEEPIAFAGIWDTWKDPQTGENKRTFSIVTCPASGRLQHIHDRMPAVLPPDEYDTWLTADPQQAKRVLEPFQGELQAYAVGKRVGSVRNNDAALLEPR